jgi:hypothetical protein
MFYPAEQTVDIDDQLAGQLSKKKKKKKKISFQFSTTTAESIDRVV